VAVSVNNPYTGKDEETCSVSFAAQQAFVGSGVSSQQTEAEFNTSQQLGEWGVITAKLAKGEIPTGTKVLTFTADSGKRATVAVNGLHTMGAKIYTPDGHSFTIGNFLPDNGQSWIKSPKLNTAIPKSSISYPAVSTGSDSVGSMSHEDVAAMFVKIKDDLSKEKGLNIKGANPELDQVVYDAIGQKTGYSGAEVKAKVDAYKADGNKLSALKKKVMAGTKTVPEGKPQPTKATPSAPLNVSQHTNKPVQDPKPNGVPTVATPKVAEEAKAKVEAVVGANPQKHFSDEDVAAQYIIAKDAVVAGSNGKWTLYSKSDQMDLEIAIKVGLKTGLNPTQQKVALASYLASGKKLSALKKQLAKQGVFEPKADTLKKSGAAKTQEEKDKDASAKAEAGYTPTSTPATGSPPTDTGKPAPKRLEKEDDQRGDISGISDNLKKLYFDKFKTKGAQSYLSSGTESNYDGLASTLVEMQEFGHSSNLTMLQLIRSVDEYGAQKAGVDNGHLFEKKVVTWLTTPAGTAHIKANEEKLLKEAEKAKLKAEAEKAAKLLEANQPPLPADSALFHPWSLEKAKSVSKTWLDENPWTIRQKTALKHYTGSSYSEMNGYLRGRTSSISDYSLEAIDGSRQGMRPTTEPILVQRGTGLDQFSELGVSSGGGSFVWGLTGKTFKDEGFLSTSAGGRAAFGGEAKLEIECPIGTPMAYVAPISNYPSENEMLLQAGMKYKILNVRKEGSSYIIRMRVVDWPGKVQ
jgi:hypothetical protein